MEYISPWLTHFVGGGLTTDTARCDLLVRILREGTLGRWERQGSVRISPGAKAISSTGRLSSNEFIGFSPVCFCDIPEASLDRHTRVYGPFGLAFQKEFLAAQGANPVFYVAKGSLAGLERPAVPPLTLEDLELDAEAALRRHFAALAAEPIPVSRAEHLDRLVRDLQRVLLSHGPGGGDPGEIDPERLERMDLFIDLVSHVFAYMKFFDESLPEESRENFYMEREWRVAGFVHFQLRDVQRVYVASGFREALEREFSGLTVQELSFSECQTDVPD